MLREQKIEREKVQKGNPIILVSTSLTLVSLSFATASFAHYSIKYNPNKLHKRTITCIYLEHSLVIRNEIVLYRKSAINVIQWISYDDIKCNFYDVTRIWMT